MSIVAVTGSTGAPGATTSALALLMAWPLAPDRRIVLVEADPDGGAVLPGALQGRVPADYGMHQLGVAHRQGALDEAFFRQLVDLSDGATRRLLLPGFTDPWQAPGLAYTWEPLADLLMRLENAPMPHDVIVDLGRRGADGAPGVLAYRADAVVQVVRTTLRSVAAAAPRVRQLRRHLDARGTGQDSLGLLVVEEGQYAVREVARQLGVESYVTLPFAPKAAAVLSDGAGDTGRAFRRSTYLAAAARAAHTLADTIAARRARLAPRAMPSPAATHAFDPNSFDPSSFDPNSPAPQGPYSGAPETQDLDAYVPGPYDRGPYDRGPYDRGPHTPAPHVGEPYASDPSTVDPGAVEPSTVDPGAVDANPGVPYAGSPYAADRRGPDPRGHSPASEEAGRV